MENTKTVTLDSISNIEDMIDDMVYEFVEDFIDEVILEAKGFGVKVGAVELVEDQDIITAEITYSDIQDVKSWFAARSPELTDEDIEDILAA